MSLLYRALKKAEDKDKKPDPESASEPPAEDADRKPARRSSRKTLLGLLLVVTVAAVGGVLYLPEIENLLVPRMVPVAGTTPPAPAGPTAAERAAEEARLAEEQRLAEEANLAEEARLAEEQRLVEEARLAEETRLAGERQLAEMIAQQQAEQADRLVEEQARLDEIKSSSRAELTLITEAVEAARREREALDLAHRLAREQAAAAAEASRAAEARAKEALAALREEIAKQRAALKQLPAAAAPQAATEAAPEASPIITAEGGVDIDALVTRQAGVQAPAAPSGPITIERASGQQSNTLAGLITVIDESDYFKDRYDAARRSINAGAANNALAIYEELLERQPRDRVALLGRATALHQQNRTGEAIRAYETVLRHHPDELAALTNLLGLAGQQTPESALQKLRRLYAANPSFGAVAAQIAMIHVKRGDNANAIRLMSEAVALEPANPSYRINLAIMHDRAGDTRAAVIAYERALLAAAGNAAALPLSVDAIRERLRYLRAN